MIAGIFKALAFILPLAFFPKSSEIFEFNKMCLVYGATVLIVGMWAAQMVRQKKIIFRRSSLDIPLLFFVLTQAIATELSIEPRTSLWGYYSRFHGGLASTICYALLYWAYVSHMDRRETKVVIRNTLAAGLVVSLWGGLEHWGRSPSCLIMRGKWDTSCWVQDVQARVFATFGQPNWMAAYLVTVIPLALQKVRKRGEKSWVGVAVILFAALWFTKSRSGLLGMGAAYAIFWGATWLQNKSKKTMRKGVVLVGVLVIAAGLLWTEGKIGAMQDSKPVDLGEVELNITPSSEIRKIVWRGAIRAWQERPIWGSGVETFAFAYAKHRPAEHNLTSEWNFTYNKAHNEFLNLAVTTGTLGLVAYLWLIVAAVRQMWKSKDKEGWNWALIAGYGGLGVTNFFGFSTVTTGLLFFLYPAMARALVSKDRKPANQEVGLVTLGLIIGCGLLALGRYWAADYYYAKGIGSNNNGDYNAAIEALEKAKELSAGEALIKIELAQALAYDRQVEKAEQTIEEAIELAPRHIKVMQLTANVYGDLGEIEGDYYLAQIAVLEKLAQMAPTDAKTTYTLALTYTRVGEMEKAKQLMEKTVALKPNYEKAKRLLELMNERERDIIEP